MSLASQSVAGSLLIDAACLLAVRQQVRADDFEVAADRAIFEAACRLADAGQAIDVVTIVQNARKHGADISDEYAATLMKVTPTAANATNYAATVHAEAVRRRLSDIGVRLMDACEDQTNTPAGIITEAMSALETADTAPQTGMRTSPDTLSAFLDYRAQLESGRAVTVGTGYPGLDKLLGGGMLAQGLYILAARPGCGKTTLSLKIAEHAAKNGACLFFSLEMSAEQITARRIAAESGLSIGRLMVGRGLLDEEQGKLANAASLLSTHDFRLNRAPGASVSDIAQAAHLAKNLRLVVVDYLGLVRSDERGLSIYERVTKNSAALKALARSLNVPILCLCQLNRASEQRTDKQPSMADLRDSGAIEQDADAVILLHRPAMYENVQQKPWEAQTLTAIVAKTVTEIPDAWISTSGAVLALSRSTGLRWEAGYDAGTALQASGRSQAAPAYARPTPEARPLGRILRIHQPRLAICHDRAPRRGVQACGRTVQGIAQKCRENPDFFTFSVDTRIILCALMRVFSSCATSVYYNTWRYT